ncbi:MAG: acyl-CoA dehydrogenase, partial [Planctomycetaceae bacterium]|nr:acyl-CoA dehydrogenase [Planctomycetaceae bacterium]
NSATGRRWADDYRIQYSLGQCEMQYISMRHGVYSTLEERWNRLEAGADLVDLSPDERIATALARTNAFRTARDIVRRLYDLLASTSIYKPSPMDRWLRDLETMCQHFMAQDQIIQSAGAYLIGGRPENPLVLGIV